ncbi:hypothetical protein NL676_012197 [Syzygium grande]|nr:hypothetical protein NL676_012197 [Syzygium grande]
MRTTETDFGGVTGGTSTEADGGLRPVPGSADAGSSPPRKGSTIPLGPLPSGTFLTTPLEVKPGGLTSPIGKLCSGLVRSGPTGGGGLPSSSDCPALSDKTPSCQFRTQHFLSFHFLEPSRPQRFKTDDDSATARVSCSSVDSLPR